MSPQPEDNSTFSPWRNLWSRPEKTLEHVLRYQPEEYLHRILIVWGTMMMFVLRIPDWMTARPDPIGVMIQVLLVGPIMGITLGYFLSMMMGNVAGWLGRAANKKVIRAGIAWSTPPFILGMLVFLVFYVALSFTLDPAQRVHIWAFSTWQGWLAVGAGIAVALYGVWIRARSLAYIFGLPAGKSVLVWVGGAVLCYLPFVGLVVVYYFLFFATLSRPVE
jgi:hypothetical protein